MTGIVSDRILMHGKEEVYKASFMINGSHVDSGNRTVCHGQLSCLLGSKNIRIWGAKFCLVLLGRACHSQPHALARLRAAKVPIKQGSWISRREAEACFYHGIRV